MGETRKVVFVVGATASGKSDWALRWADEFKGVIFNCDSIQVYEKTDIGAAKATPEERARVPHFLIDYVAPPQEMTAGEYARDFFLELQKVPVSQPVFVVGGTGFYFTAIEKGMYPVTKVSPQLQAQVQAELLSPGGPEKLHGELAARDPEYGRRIHAADHYRLGRAIELIRSQGKSVTEIQREFNARQRPFPHPLLKVAPLWEKEELHQRIQARTLKMVEAGLADEVRGLLAEGLETWSPLTSVGYRETIAYLKGHLSREEWILEIAKNTRQLAKKQKTWFQRDKDIHWFSGREGFVAARDLVEKFLNS